MRGATRTRLPPASGVSPPAAAAADVNTTGAEAWRLSLDQPLHGTLARFTGGISPAALTQAYVDWAQHLLLSPDKQAELGDKAARKWFRYLDYASRLAADPGASLVSTLCPGPPL